MEMVLAAVVMYGQLATKCSQFKLMGNKANSFSFKWKYVIWLEKCIKNEYLSMLNINADTTL